MKIGLFYSYLEQLADKLGTTTEKVLKEAKRIGYDYIEADWDIISEKNESFFDYLNEIGLKIALYSFIGPDFKTDKHRFIKDDLYKISSLGISRIMIIWRAFGDTSKEKMIEDIKNSENGFFDEASREGIIITAEDFDNTDLPCASCKDLLVFKKIFPNLKFTYDTGNFMIHGENTLECFDIMKDYIAHVHIKDRESSAEHSLPLIPGKGRIPIKEILHKLYEIGYDEWITAELPFEDYHDLEILEACFSYIINNFS